MFAVEVTKPIPSRVFMEIDWASDECDRQAVVFVETDKFVAAWRREPHGFDREAAHGKLDSPRVEKYKAIKDDFARSQQQPVPLAHVICRQDEEKKTDVVTARMCGRRYVDPRTQPYYVDFNEGVTRTFWLIANGARAFPVGVDASEASALHDEAGMSEFPPMTIKQLFEAARNMPSNSDEHRIVAGGRNTRDG